MIYALWEIVVPLIVVFLIGVALGIWVQRGRGTRISADQWERVTQRAQAADRLEGQVKNVTSDTAEISDLRAAIEVRDIEISQLRQAIADSDTP